MSLRTARMMMRPGKDAAMKELRGHALLLGAWCLAIRAAPYLLHAAKGSLGHGPK